MDILGIQHPFFRPLWRRVVVVLFCIAWAVIEFVYNASPFWAGLFAAIGLYCSYQFFVAFDPPQDQSDKP